MWIRSNKVQTGPGIEVSMRNRMIEMQREVSNRTLRSAAATRQAKSGSLAGLRAFIGTRLSLAGQQLANPTSGSMAGESPTVICAG
jgi:hypothetical protein